jgi:predicted heme/steroid binding protein
MKKRILYITMALGGMLYLTACQNAAYDVIDEGVYISEAENGNLKKITIDNTGGKATVTVRAAESCSNDMHVTIGTATTDELAAFNKRNGTSYVALPADNYSLSSSDVTLSKGKVTAPSVEVAIKPLTEDQINSGDKYVLPISILSADGSVLESAKTMFYAIDQVIITQAPYLADGQIKIAMEKQIKTLPWTLEYRVWVKSLDPDRAMSVESASAGPATEIYIRWGDANVDGRLVMMKTQAGQFISTKQAKSGQWYHHAWVHDGKTVKLYINGELDAQMDSPGKMTELGKEMGFYTGYTGSMFSEVRFWSVARTQKQIKENMFSVSPTSDGLEMYLKLNEGKDKTFKDYAGKNGVTATATGNVQWNEIRSDQQ